MKKIILTIFVFLVFITKGNGQHYFTLPQLERICSYRKTDDIYSLKNYVSKFQYVNNGKLYSDINRFKDSYGNEIQSFNLNDKKNPLQKNFIVWFTINNPSKSIIESYRSYLDKHYWVFGIKTKSYISSGKYIIDFKVENNKLIIKLFNNVLGILPNPAKVLSKNKIAISPVTNFTLIKVKKGDRISFNATGTMTLGVMAGKSTPAGLKGFQFYNVVSSYPHGSLMGRIGTEGGYFLIGTSSSFIASKDGYLDVRINDIDPSNNSGYYYLTYSINGASPKKLSEPIPSKKSNCLLGDCYNEFSRIKYDNGDVYTGYFKAGIRHGKGGSYTWANGDKYFGEWLNGKRTGRGIYTWADGNSFEGKFDDGKRVDGLGIYTWKNGTNYKGNFANNLMHGKGTLFYATGGWYTGDFVKGKRHGKGKLYNAKGTLVYDGLWEQDKKTSQ